MTRMMKTRSYGAALLLLLMSCASTVSNYPERSVTDHLFFG